MILGCVIDIYNTGKISLKLWNSFMKEIPELYAFESNIESLTRETKVIELEKTINLLLNNKKLDNSIISFILAYKVSQIAYGSFKYIDLLIPYSKELPTLIIWYGFIAGLYQKSQINNIENGLGWKIIKDLSSNNDLIDRPRTDISYDELHLLKINVIDKLLNEIVNENNNFIKIEIFPNVEIYLKLKDDVKNKVYESKENKKNIVYEIENISKKLAEVMQNLQKVKIDIKSNDPESISFRDKKTKGKNYK